MYKRQPLTPRGHLGYPKREYNSRFASILKKYTISAHIVIVLQEYQNPTSKAVIDKIAERSSNAITSIDILQHHSFIREQLSQELENFEKFKFGKDLMKQGAKYQVLRLLLPL